MSSTDGLGNTMKARFAGRTGSNDQFEIESVDDATSCTAIINSPVTDVRTKLEEARPRWHVEILGY